MNETPPGTEPSGKAAAPAAPGPAHHALGVFVGRWRTEGEVASDDGGPPARLVATDSYAWLPGGFFLEHRVEGRRGDDAVRALEVIGYDEACRAYFTHSYDNAGSHAQYEAALDGRGWTITGPTERFAGAFSEDGRTLAGTWERTTDGTRWRPWMTIRLARVEAG